MHAKDKHQNITAAPITVAKNNIEQKQDKCNNNNKKKHKHSTMGKYRWIIVYSHNETICHICEMNEP